MQTKEENNLKQENFFAEHQRLRHPFFWAFILFVFCLAVYGFVMQIILEKPVGMNPAPNWVMWFLLFFVLALVSLAGYCRLELMVSPKGVGYRYAPFINRRRILKWEDIKSAEVKKYSPLKEFGGWGLRFGFKGGIAYSVQGNMGLRLELISGKKIVIGCHDAEGLKAYLKDLKAKYKIQSII